MELSEIDLFSPEFQEDPDPAYALTRFADIEALLDRFDGGRACRESFSFQRVACARRRVRGNVGLLPNFLNEVIQWPTPRSNSDP